MKLNERVFEKLSGEPVEVQEFDGRRVEIFYLDDYPDVLNEFINKGKFAVWSSIDGVNYRLGIEKGYYSELTTLYSSKVNQIWLNFWDECEHISSNFSKKIVLPTTLVIVVVFVVLMALSKKLGNVGTYVTLGLAIAYVFAILVLRKFTTNKINAANGDALSLIKKEIGEATFNNLLEKQRNYIDAYYDAQAAQAEQEEEASKETEEDAQVAEEPEVEDTNVEETEAEEPVAEDTEADEADDSNEEAVESEAVKALEEKKEE